MKQELHLTTNHHRLWLLTTVSVFFALKFKTNESDKRNGEDRQDAGLPVFHSPYERFLLVCIIVL